MKTLQYDVKRVDTSV